MEEFIKKIKKEDVLYFGFGIAIGLLIVLILKEIKLKNTLQKKAEEFELDNLYLVHFDAAQIEKAREINAQEEKRNEEEKQNKVFPLKKGSNGKEVEKLHEFLENDYEAQIDEKEKDEQLFGESTLDAVKINLKKDTISERYYQKAIA